jgi:hypothetical protein
MAFYEKIFNLWTFSELEHEVYEFLDTVTTVPMFIMTNNEAEVFDPEVNPAPEVTTYVGADGVGPGCAQAVPP